VGVVQQPGDGHGGAGFGHKFVEAGGVQVRRHRDRSFLLGGVDESIESLGCVGADGQQPDVIFTPDLMALLIDEAAPFDVEIIDQWLFVYATRPFTLADAATYQRLLRIVATVGAKTLSQTDRYVDDYIGEFTANLVAPAGQRLRSGVNWADVVIVGLVIVVWSLGVMGSMLL